MVLQRDRPSPLMMRHKNFITCSKQIQVEDWLHFCSVFQESLQFGPICEIAHCFLTSQIGLYKQRLETSVYQIRSLSYDGKEDVAIYENVSSSCGAFHCRRSESALLKRISRFSMNTTRPVWSSMLSVLTLKTGTFTLRCTAKIQIAKLWPNYQWMFQIKGVESCHPFWEKLFFFSLMREVLDFLLFLFHILLP